MEYTQLFGKLNLLIEANSSNELVKHQDLKKINLTDLNIGNKNYQDVFDWIEYYLKYSVNTSHPNFANRMWSGANTPSILGEIVTAITNTSACTYESAPVSTMLEKAMIKQMLDIVGFKDGEGQMTTGSSNANMIAMMVARNQHLKTSKKNGLFAQQRCVAFVNEDAHYSLDKAANILGIGSDNLIKVKTNSKGEMDITELEKLIKNAKNNNAIPFFVCATLGTTVTGAYDSIEELLKLRDKYNFFLHGDGAWGGAAIMSEKLKSKFLSGLEKLNSFTMDFHKILNSALICNFLLINKKQSLIQTCATGDVSYIFREDSDLGVQSLQCGRRVDSLKWFLDWVYFGKKNFSKRVENYYNLASFAQKLVKQYDELEIVSPHYSFNLCFRFKPTNNIDVNEFNQQLRDNLYKNSEALLSLAYIDKKLIFRLVIANPKVTEQTLTNLFELFIKNGRSLLSK